VVGTDPQTDIVLIRMQADNLPALTFADSDKVNIGDVVLAVGNPFGVGQPVSSGIVSAKNRVTSFILYTRLRRAELLRLWLLANRTDGFADRYESRSDPQHTCK